MSEGCPASSDERRAATEEVLARVEAGDIETVRVQFVDQHGVLRGKTLVAGAMRSVLARGITVPSTLLLKDTSNRTAFPVWSADSGIHSGPMQGAGDVMLMPDARTFRTLPWAPHSAWILCDVFFKNGAVIPFSSRHVLQKSIDRLAQAGLSACMGLEVEFHVFQRLDPSLAHGDTTMPGRPPETRALTQGWQLLSASRYGEVEELLDHLRRNAQGLGLPVHSVEIEMGPSQFEFTFQPGAPMRQADDLVMFRAMVRELCAARGLHATFMARPRVENGAASGWHIHQSLLDRESGANLFMPPDAGVLTPQASGWIAGLLAHAAESSLLIAPTVNAYKRYKPYQLAPNHIGWGRDNRGAMVRALLEPGDSASRIENRAPESAANPYFAIAAQILSGLAGIRAGRQAPEPTETPYDDDAHALPATLDEAIGHFSGSALYRAALGDEFVDVLTRIKRAEWDRYLAEVSQWEQAEYFALF